MVRIFPLLVGFFLLIPLIEIALFVVIGGEIGLLATVLVVIATGIIGATVISQQGIAVMETLQRDLAEKRVPVKPVIEGFLLLAAALMLITPGFATDALGFCLAVPPLRRQLGAWVRKAAMARGAFTQQTAGDRPPGWGGGPHAGEGKGPIIEGEIIDSDRHDPPTKS